MSISENILGASIETTEGKTPVAPHPFLADKPSQGSADTENLQLFGTTTKEQQNAQPEKSKEEQVPRALHLPPPPDVEEQPGSSAATNVHTMDTNPNASFIAKPEPNPLNSSLLQTQKMAPSTTEATVPKGPVAPLIPVDAGIARPADPPTLEVKADMILQEEKIPTTPNDALQVNKIEMDAHVQEFSLGVEKVATLASGAPQTDVPQHNAANNAPPVQVRPNASSSITIQMPRQEQSAQMHVQPQIQMLTQQQYNELIATLHRYRGEREQWKTYGLGMATHYERVKNERDVLNSNMQRVGQENAQLVQENKKLSNRLATIVNTASGRSATVQQTVASAPVSLTLLPKPPQKTMPSATFNKSDTLLDIESPMETVQVAPTSFWGRKSWKLSVVVTGLITIVAAIGLVVRFGWYGESPVKLPDGKTLPKNVLLKFQQWELDEDYVCPATHKKVEYPCSGKYQACILKGYDIGRKDGVGGEQKASGKNKCKPYIIKKKKPVVAKKKK